MIWGPIPQIANLQNYPASPKCSLTQKHSLRQTTQPSSMGMPLDMILACSNHASWNCGLLAFGLPSASNKLSQPDPSEVPSALKAEKESMYERERQKNESKHKVKQTENEITHLKHTVLLPHPIKATQSVLIVYWCWRVLSHSGFTSQPLLSCSLWFEGTTFLLTAWPLLTLSLIATYQSAQIKLSLSNSKSKGSPCCFVVLYLTLYPSKQIIS